MTGFDILELSDAGTDGAWSVAFREMGVGKVGVYIERNVKQENSNYNAKIKMLSVVVEKSLTGKVCWGFPLALVTYTGFNFQPTGAFFRDVVEKKFMWRSINVCDAMRFYVSEAFEENVKEFVFGKPIVLVEGVLDAECLSYLTGYNYVMAMMTAYCNLSLAAFISSITDKVLLVPDNDEGGIKGVGRSMKNFDKFGVEAKYLQTLQKDFGDVYRYRDKVDVSKTKTMLKYM